MRAPAALAAWQAGATRCPLRASLLNRMNVQVGKASTAAHAAILRRLCVRLMWPVHVGIAAQMMTAILKVVIDAIADRFATLRQGQVRRIRGKEAHVRELARGLAAAATCLNDHTMKRMVLRLLRHGMDGVRRAPENFPAQKKEP